MTIPDQPLKWVIRWERRRASDRITHGGESTTGDTGEVLQQTRLVRKASPSRPPSDVHGRALPILPHKALSRCAEGSRKRDVTGRRSTVAPCAWRVRPAEDRVRVPPTSSVLLARELREGIGKLAFGVRIGGARAGGKCKRPHLGSWRAAQRCGKRGNSGFVLDRDTAAYSPVNSRSCLMRVAPAQWLAACFRVVQRLRHRRQQTDAFTTLRHYLVEETARDPPRSRLIGVASF